MNCIIYIVQNEKLFAPQAANECRATLCVVNSSMDKFSLVMVVASPGSRTHRTIGRAKWAASARCGLLSSRSPRAGWFGVRYSAPAIPLEHPE